jgi:hypothetical protein
MSHPAEAALPPLYAPWLREVTGGPIPGETKATCDHCVMLRSPESPPEAVHFHPATKCCAYQPDLPNFLAGRILSEADPSMAEGRASLERRIERRVAVTPSGAGSGGVFKLLYGHTPQVFGRAPALRCPYLSPEGSCGVWRHRPGVCATWYCKHVRGASGLRFWKLADKLLREVECDLALWCLAELHTGVAELASLAPERRDQPDVSELDGEVDVPRYRKLWGEWAGREIAFYQACAALVEPLSWERVQGICGPRVRVLADLVRDAYENLMSDAIPDRLKLGGVRLEWVAEGGLCITAYSEFDPLLISRKLAAVLPYFDGRPTEDALAAILSEQGLSLAPALVRRMLDFGVLVACERRDAGPFPIL